MKDGKVKGTNTLNGVRNGFVPGKPVLQSRSEDRSHASAGGQNSTTGEIARKYQIESPSCWIVGEANGAPKGIRRFPESDTVVQVCPRWRTRAGSRKLKRKIGQLTMENDFLKKGLRHFGDYPARQPSSVARMPV